MAVERFRVQVNGEWYDVALETRDGKETATIGDKTWAVDLKQYSDTSLVSLLLDTRSLELLVEPQGETYTILKDIEQYRAVVRPAWAAESRRGVGESGDGEVTVSSPLVGVVVDVRVSAGQIVDQGETLLVIEAMKMQNEMRAPKAGLVKAVRVRKGQKVIARQPLVTVI